MIDDDAAALSRALGAFALREFSPSGVYVSVDCRRFADLVDLTLKNGYSLQTVFADLLRLCVEHAIRGADGQVDSYAHENRSRSRRLGAE